MSKSLEWRDWRGKHTPSRSVMLSDAKFHKDDLRGETLLLMGYNPVMIRSMHHSLTSCGDHKSGEVRGGRGGEVGGGEEGGRGVREEEKEGE